MSRCARVGLTGGIGSGKTTVAAMFATLDVPVLDLDVVGKIITEPGQKGLSRIIEVFGKKIIFQDGRLNRAALAEYCFKNKQRTEELNAILHPLIWAYEANWLSQQDSPYVLIEASVLIESGGISRMDAIVVVSASLAVRKLRVLNRDSHEEKRFNNIVARQCDNQARLKAADYLLNNDHHQDGLQQQVKSVHQQLLQRFSG
ncbi:MAG: dephospho-CoA kinase [Mariprofundaceae bacterium]